ncbi:hypothetical protein KJ616_02005, partial [Patescibacteria group bacterium]|nr:hypothetical protein [Patescibacteria group bacterium]
MNYINLNIRQIQFQDSAEGRFLLPKAARFCRRRQGSAEGRFLLPKAARFCRRQVLTAEGGKVLPKAGSY